MQKILPAFSSIKQYEKFLRSDYEIGVFLETHISQLVNIHKLAQQYQKNIIYHVDLIHGLKNDDYATEYICQQYEPYGIISTKSNVILKAKQKGVIAIQRMFLIDSHALEKSYRLVEKTKPDYLEVLPGAMPWMIKEVKERTNTKIFAGGLIRTTQEVENALAAGADAITTSNREIWDYFE
jgi:glycerol uptake operon antiterminator